MVFRLIQISDTHLGADKRYFVRSFEQVCEVVESVRPDLVVNTGDMSLDGANSVQDLVQARHLHDAIGSPVDFIPGNHDLGDVADAPVHGEGSMAEERRERYLRYFGSDFWMRDVPGWRLLGINAQLLGSVCDAGSVQLDFVRDAVATNAGRSLALFTHKPLFDSCANETAITGRFVNPTPRRLLLRAIASANLALVGSGHVHQYRSVSIDGVRHVWAPSTAYVLPDSVQPIYGAKLTGYVEHLLESNGAHKSRLVTIPGLPILNIADFPGAYPGAFSQRPN